MGDFIKTKISDWKDWEHNRISVLVKDEYITVFDNAKGSYPRTVGITWNLKGDSVFSTNSVKLVQDPYTVNLFYPHSEEDSVSYTPNIKGKYLPAGNIHDPDFTLFLLEEDAIDFGVSAVIIPEKGVDNKVVKITVTNTDEEESFPEAIGVKIVSSNFIDMLGANFGIKELSYENIKTDADVFLLRNSTGSVKISFGHASFFEIFSEYEPTLIELNGKKLENLTEWTYLGNKISIEEIKEEGDIKITFN